MAGGRTDLYECVAVCDAPDPARHHALHPILKQHGSHQLADASDDWEVWDELCASCHWAWLGQLWICDDAPMVRADWWRARFEEPPLKWKRHFMTREDQGAYDALPDTLRVYRGYSRPGGRDGFAWTPDREQAVWFAENWVAGKSPRLGLWGVRAEGEQVSRIATGTVAKSDIIGFLGGRQESEIVVPPALVAVDDDRLTAPSTPSETMGTT